MSALEELGRRLDANHHATALPKATTCVSCLTTTDGERHTPSAEEQQRAEAFLRLFAVLDPPPDPA